MLPLVITIKQVDGGTRRYAFAESPVSIGRSPFAELQLLEPFISRWEGTLRFDDDEITYFRLGSTNSTYVNGERLERREDDVPLRVDSVLTVGDLELRWTFIALTGLDGAPDPAPPVPNPGPVTGSLTADVDFPPGGTIFYRVVFEATDSAGQTTSDSIQIAVSSVILL